MNLEILKTTFDDFHQRGLVACKKSYEEETDFQTRPYIFIVEFIRHMQKKKPGEINDDDDEEEKDGDGEQNMTSVHFVLKALDKRLASRSTNDVSIHRLSILKDLLTHSFNRYQFEMRKLCYDKVFRQKEVIFPGYTNLFFKNITFENAMNNAMYKRHAASQLEYNSDLQVIRRTGQILRGQSVPSPPPQKKKDDGEEDEINACQQKWNISNRCCHILWSQLNDLSDEWLKYKLTKLNPRKGEGEEEEEEEVNKVQLLLRERVTKVNQASTKGDLQPQNYFLADKIQQRTVEFISNWSHILSQPQWTLQDIEEMVKKQLQAIRPDFQKEKDQLLSLLNSSSSSSNIKQVKEDMAHILIHMRTNIQKENHDNEMRRLQSLTTPNLQWITSEVETFTFPDVPAVTVHSQSAVQTYHDMEATCIEFDVTTYQLHCLQQLQTCDSLVHVNDFIQSQKNDLKPVLLDCVTTWQETFLTTIEKETTETLQTFLQPVRDFYTRLEDRLNKQEKKLLQEAMTWKEKMHTELYTFIRKSGETYLLYMKHVLHQEVPEDIQRTMEHELKQVVYTLGKGLHKLQKEKEKEKEENENENEKRLRHERVGKLTDLMKEIKDRRNKLHPTLEDFVFLAWFCTCAQLMLDVFLLLPKKGGRMII